MRAQARVAVAVGLAVASTVVAAPAFAGSRADTTITEYCFDATTGQLVLVTATVDANATGGFLTEEAIGYGLHNPFNQICNITGVPPTP